MIRRPLKSTRSNPFFPDPTPFRSDQTRWQGPDRKLNSRAMGTSYLTQASNKRSMTLDLKTEAGRSILKRLVSGADVMVENYRAGAFPELGLDRKSKRLNSSH